MKKHLLILLSLFLALSNLKAEYVLDAGTITSSDMTAGFFDDLWDTVVGHQFQLKLTGTVMSYVLNEFTDSRDMN